MTKIKNKEYLLITLRNIINNLENISYNDCPNLITIKNDLEIFENDLEKYFKNNTEYYKN